MNVMFCWMSSYFRSLEIYYDRWWRINIVVGEFFKCLMLSAPNKWKLFMFSFPPGIGKDAFSWSVTIYVYVAEAVFICFCKVTITNTETVDIGVKFVVLHCISLQNLNIFLVLVIEIGFQGLESGRNRESLRKGYTLSEVYDGAIISVSFT